MTRGYGVLKGSRLRLVTKVTSESFKSTSGILECGHTFTKRGRFAHTSVEKGLIRVVCRDCAGPREADNGTNS